MRLQFGLQASPIRPRPREDVTHLVQIGGPSVEEDYYRQAAAAGATTVVFHGGWKGGKGEEWGGWYKRPTAELLDLLDEVGVETYVILDGGWGEDILYRHLDRFKAAAPERFIHYGGIPWSYWPEHGDRFGEWAAGRLREQVARGALELLATSAPS